MKGETCKRQRCTRPVKIVGLCLTHAKKEADQRFSAIVRQRGKCELQTPGDVQGRCAGILQCCHILSRRYLNTRWDLDNALCGCQGHHVYYTHRPLEWERFIESVRPGTIEDLRAKALGSSGLKVDYAQLLEELA